MVLFVLGSVLQSIQNAAGWFVLLLLPGSVSATI